MEVAERVGAEQSTLRNGNITLILFQAGAESTEPRQVTFGIGRDAVVSWRRHLEDQRIPIVDEVSWPNGMQSIVFCDPTGNRIQLRTQESSQAARLRAVPSRGLPAQWKIYQAARMAISDREAVAGE